VYVYVYVYMYMYMCVHVHEYVYVYVNVCVRATVYVYEIYTPRQVKRLKKFRLPRPGKPRTPLTLPRRCGVGQARKRACDTFTRNTHSNKTDSQYVKNSTLAFVKENGETREETLKRSDCWNELIPPSSTPRGAREVCVTLLSKGFVPYSDRGKRQEHEFMRAHVCLMTL
jgi:hypothetical protein